ncbi:sodium:solute symporter family protein [Cellvibrio polysaccharolyticus]|uniref:Sodium:solute symporter family protein n=1 Tax=Cellvibrio polysaccharolyticus TaxID=2082724 RepID=A0A928V4E2_9GAMM|nr:sodium:solute symporter family protein [Cellvibrio polysaccharolyticus]MBE8716990.1 sodium:solute symporter family protein [Cellvibrio polysaccharolyticus]
MNTSVFVSAFVIYIAFLVWLGWFVSRQQRGGEDFLLAGRSLPMMLTLATTLATMVGTGSSIGAVGFAYSNGWAGTLYGIGGALGILLTAWWFAPVRAQRFMTMSEELSWYVGANRYVKNLVGVLILLACIGWLGAHILGGGMYLAWIAGVDPTIAKLLIAAGFSIYIVIGGYRAVVWTDAIQVVVLFFGFILMAAMSVYLAGGWESLMSDQPRENLSFLGIEKIGAIHALSLVAVIMVGVMATPSFRQRIYSASSVKAARNSFALSGSLYLFFSFIPALIGMAAYAMNPDLENRNFSFPFLAMEVLPLTVGVIVLIAGLSATMSSASSDAIAGVAILLRDIYILFTGRVPAEQNMVRYSRIGLVAIIGVSMLLAFISDDIIVYITGMIATIMSGMCACGVLGRFWQRYTWQGAIASLMGGSLISGGVMLSPSLMTYWGNPIIPAMGGAFAAGILISLLTPRNKVSPDEAADILARERDIMEVESR